jgi:hypothetical protein
MRIPLLLTLLTGCTTPNPAFDRPGGSTDQSVTTGEPPPATTGTPTTGDLDTSSTGAPPTTGVTSLPVDTTTTLTDATTTTTTNDASTTDETTAGPETCWPLGASGWPLAGAELDAFADDNPVDPFITPDGLRLYYVALTQRRPFLSTRPDRGQPFPNGVVLTVWKNDPQYTPGYLALPLGEEEMLMSNQGDVYVSLHTPQDADKYSTPVPLAGTNTGSPEHQVTATADGQLLIVSRDDGPPIPPLLPQNSPRFHQFTRDQPTPGAGFTGDQDVTPLVEPLHLAICPALSPDGLHLFFASTEANKLDQDNAEEVVGIYYTSRPARDAAWAAPGRISVANGDGGVTCPSSVTADGCELAYHQFRLGQDDYRMYLAVRAP